MRKFSGYTHAPGVLRVPEILAAHGIEKFLRVAELQPVIFLLLEQPFLHRGSTEVENVVVVRAEKDVVRPAIEHRGRQPKITAVHLVEHRAIAVESVGRNGYYIVSRPQPQAFCQFNGAQHVADTRWAENIAHRERKAALHAHLDQGIRAIVEVLHSPHGFLVLDEDHEIGVEDVVDERAHLVADAFNAMLSAPAVGKCGALVRFQRSDFRFGKRGLDLVARRIVPADPGADESRQCARCRRLLPRRSRCRR